MDTAEELKRCRSELYRLVAENAALRYAAQSFGDLAERLNLILKHQSVPAVKRPGQDDPASVHRR